MINFLCFSKCPKEYQDKYSNIKDEKRQKMLGLVSLLDDSIGNITKTLDEQNLLDETLIIFMSDVKFLN